jgi:hypothetical protein
MEEMEDTLDRVLFEIDSETSCQNPFASVYESVEASLRDGKLAEGCFFLERLSLLHERLDVYLQQRFPICHKKGCFSLRDGFEKSENLQVAEALIFDIISCGDLFDANSQ